MCFSDKSGNDGDEDWYGYIEDGKGWALRPKSEYMQTPAYNNKLHAQYKREQRKYGKEAVPSSAQSKKWVTPENAGRQ
jgi:hypothetical protein